MGGVVGVSGTALLLLLVNSLEMSDDVAFWIELVVTLEAKYILDALFAFEKVKPTTAGRWVSSWTAFHFVRLPLLVVESAMFHGLRFFGFGLVVSSVLPILVGFTLYYVFARRLVFVRISSP